MITKTLNNKHYITGLATGILISFLAFYLISNFRTNSLASNIYMAFQPKPTPTPDIAKAQAEITKAVIPDKVNLGISFKDVVVKMVEAGAIDKDKFLALYQQRGGLSPEEKGLLDNPSDKPIVVTAANSGLILNLLWPLGIANKTAVLSEGPMGTQYNKDVNNFASTGGWTVGKEDGGKLFNRFPLVTLTPDQEAEVKDIAQNIYRPCCGNSTYFPDCNHGAAMLGFIELAVSQGLPKDEIYKKALALNTYWFPQTYVELGVYFKNKKNTSWDKVDPKEALGVTYSSGQGYGAIDKQLQDGGLLPKVNGGGGCGV